MKKQTPLPETLRLLRELPPEVSLEQVRRWVRERPRRRRDSQRWLPLLLARFWNPGSQN